LSTVLRVPVALTVAGRTDAGVHAAGQVVHLDVPRDAWQREQPSLLRRLAGLLPPDVRVRGAREVPADFDARFAALWRRYEYRLSDAPWGVEPLRRHHVLAWPRRLDETAMADAAKGLVGLHDFAAFCRQREGATTIRHLQRLDWSRDGDRVTAYVSADAFCWSMVRSLVGALLAVGEHRREPGWCATLLRCTKRSSDFAAAPPHGLTFVAVDYPPDDELEARTKVTRDLRVVD